jgi:hypothetical protein
MWGSVRGMSALSFLKSFSTRHPVFWQNQATKRQPPEGAVLTAGT